MSPRSFARRRLPTLWWATPVAALAVAVAVAASAGQPRPASPASGVSVPVRPAAATASPPVASRLTIITDTVTPAAIPAGAPVGVPAVTGRTPDLVTSAIWWYDQAAGTLHRFSLPDGARPLSLVGIAGGVVALGVVPGQWQSAYLIRGVGAAPTVTRLGLADTVVPTADGHGAWLVVGGFAHRIDGAGHLQPGRIRIPAGYALAGAVGTGLIISSRPGLGPGRTWLLRPGYPATGVGAGQAIAVSRGRVLLRLGVALSVVDLGNGQTNRLPIPSAVIASDRAALSPDGRRFAVMGRTAGHPRLVVGPVTAGSAHSLHVLPLDGSASATPVTPAWTSDPIVVAARPDGRLVVYRNGDQHGWLLRDGPRHVATVAVG